ncbi:MAG: hypothetical protein UR66_C0003G0166 [Candidatus Moranbacteria bacterium GW2011_GWE1_35_17]|nr:MAG: hypothetical protein UR66_C0003G0166 [Candidatus Moranbacteria bacterium GW2011_GWE1_35_17]KKP84461.1 MAG: hypothetical protein UR82_C0005G0003 [Candidatus Moranbacteria bacterium GW2011_GWF1_35_5]
MNRLKNIFDDKFVGFYLSLKITKSILILVIIIVIGAFLRLYDFNDLLRFNNDQVRDAQIIDAMHSGENFPLFGPKAGGTKFNLGGAFYYLEYLSGAIFGFSPAGIAFFIPLLSIASIYLFYLLFKKIFSINITLGLTFLYAISFYAIKYSHFAWNPNVIPFFILAFLLLLSRIVSQSNQDAINRASTYLDFIFLGIIIGISAQLHTTLLILMPLMTLLTILYAYFKKINISLKNIFLLIFFFILINIPFVYGNFLDHGENLREFLAGTSTKTGASLSIVKNTAADIKFFLQGSSYYLTGIEPQKNWSNVIKLIKSHNLTELSLFVFSLIIFFGGIYLLFSKKTQANRRTIANDTILILSTFTLLAFLFFLLIGNELNLRFFIILSFLPYLFLGAISQYLSEKINSLQIKAILFLSVLAILIFSNLNMFTKTYNLNNYRAPQSAYGGISLGELNELCLKMDNALKSKPGASQTAFIDSFEFKRSLTYVCAKTNLALEEFSSGELIGAQLFFVIVENENIEKNIQKYTNSFKLENSQKIKRFTLLTFKSIQ